MATVEKVKQYREQLTLMRKAYMSDGTISPEEQKSLDALEALIAQAEEKVGAGTKGVKQGGAGTKNGEVYDVSGLTVGNSLTKVFSWSLYENDNLSGNEFMGSLETSVTWTQITAKRTGRRAWVITQVSLAAANGPYLGLVPSFTVQHQNNTSHAVKAILKVFVRVTADEAYSTTSNTTVTGAIKGSQMNEISASLNGTVPGVGEAEGSIGSNTGAEGSANFENTYGVTQDVTVSNYCEFSYGMTTDGGYDGSATGYPHPASRNDPSAVADFQHKKLNPNVGEIGEYEFALTDSEWTTGFNLG